MAGAYSVEFALLLGLFCVFLYVSLEMARASYLVNIIYAVTERAARRAAVTDFSDAAAMQRLRSDAVFRTEPGPLMLAGGIDDRYVRIDYLSLAAGAPTAAGLGVTPLAVLPACPKLQKVACMNDPNGSGCIRFVRARLCLPGGEGCTPVPYSLLLPGLAQVYGAVAAFSLSDAATLVPAASLGYRPSAPNTGCP